jgi:protocatechuate 3,4-dioxygenase beta subunit
MKHDHHDEGLAYHLPHLVGESSRRRALRLFAGAGLVPWLGCGSERATGGGPGGAGSCTNTPGETAGPFPGDGSNGPNALDLGGIVRSDIRSSIGALSGTAAGVPLTVDLTLVDTSAGCAPLTGYAVYLWHCDREGRYSLYTITDQNYLRGIQETGATGTATFVSVFPGCYPGRWPHIHFEIYRSLPQAAMASGSKVKISQLALPAEACQTVYATAGYEQSVTNLSRITLASDSVFSDGVTLQLAGVSGSVTSGYVASLMVGVAA